MRLACLIFGGKIPGGPGSVRGSCLRLNALASWSILWLDSSIASEDRSSRVTRSTAKRHNKSSVKIIQYQLKVQYKIVQDQLKVQYKTVQDLLKRQWYNTKSTTKRQFECWSTTERQFECSSTFKKKIECWHWCT